MKQYFLYIFLLLILSACGGGEKTTDYSFLYEDEDAKSLDSLDIIEDNVTEIIYNNHIYQTKIHTVLLHPFGFELGEPILDLNKQDSLLLAFDELDSDFKNYYYTHP